MTTNTELNVKILDHIFRHLSLGHAKAMHPIPFGFECHAGSYSISG